jgi:hypothetical protein
MAAPAAARTRRTTLPGLAGRVVLLITALCRQGHAQQGAHAVEQLTGAHTRVVWVQDQSDSQRDSLARERKLALMGFDSRDGALERRLVPLERNFAKPLLTPDGSRVVWSDHFADRAFVVNWDGTGRRALAEGFALDVWADPATGTQWVYMASRASPKENYVYHKVSRVQLDNPKVREPVWDKTEISPDNFQLSADGTKAAGEFPWPNAGVAELPNGALRRLASGCWASLSPDNSYVCSVFDGAHRNLRLFGAAASNPSVVPLAGLEALDGHEAFHPRWTNHPRMMVLTGPYKRRGPVNFITGGGPEVEVFMIKFTEAFDAIESWTQVTHNARGDFHPDAWISRGEQATVSRPQTAAPAAALRSWPTHKNGLAFVWRNANSVNEIEAEKPDSTSLCEVQSRDAARFDRNFALDCRDGWFVASPNDNLAATCRKAEAFAIELLLTPPEQAPRKAARIFEFSRDEGGVNFAIEQMHQRFSIRVLTRRSNSTVEAVYTLGELPNRPQHLVLSLTPRGLLAWVNGQPERLPRQPLGTLDSWGMGRLHFGANASGGQRWEGRLEFMALFTRPLTEADAGPDYQTVAAQLAERRPVEQARVQARLLEATATTEPESILPYQRALVVHRYQIERVLAGTMPSRQFLAAKWGIMSGRKALNAVETDAGVFELLLERFEDHAELASERQLIDVETGTLPLYYDVGTRPVLDAASRPKPGN